MALMSIGRNYRMAAKSGLGPLADMEERRETANKQIKMQEKGQRQSMTATGAGLGLAAAKSGLLGGAAPAAATTAAAPAAATAGGSVLASGAAAPAAAAAAPVLPMVAAGAGLGYLLSRIF